MHTSVTSWIMSAVILFCESFFRCIVASRTKLMITRSSILHRGVKYRAKGHGLTPVRRGCSLDISVFLVLSMVQIPNKLPNMKHDLLRLQRSWLDYASNGLWRSFWLWIEGRFFCLPWCASLDEPTFLGRELLLSACTQRFGTSKDENYDRGILSMVVWCLLSTPIRESLPTRAAN